MTWALRALVCPNSVTVTVLAPATTWLLVSTSPSGVRIIPVPAPSTSPLPVPPEAVPPVNRVVSIETTAGSTLASTLWMSVGWASTLRFGKNFSRRLLPVEAHPQPDAGADQGGDDRGDADDPDPVPAGERLDHPLGRRGR